MMSDLTILSTSVRMNLSPQSSGGGDGDRLERGKEGPKEGEAAFHVRWTDLV